MSDGKVDHGELADPTEGCRDGWKFGCGYGCGWTCRTDHFPALAKAAANHYNEEHADSLSRSHERVDTWERSVSHIRDNVYQVERIPIYLTPFDMIQRIGLEDGWLAAVDSDRVCPACHCVIPDSDARVDDEPNDPFVDDWTCETCLHTEEVDDKRNENQQLTEWSA